MLAYSFHYPQLTVFVLALSSIDMAIEHKDIENGENNGPQALEEPLITSSKCESGERAIKDLKREPSLWMVLLCTLVAVCGSFEFGSCVGSVCINIFVIMLVKFEVILIAVNLRTWFSVFRCSCGVPELMSESSFCFEPDNGIWKKGNKKKKKKRKGLFSLCYTFDRWAIQHQLNLWSGKNFISLWLRFISLFSQNLFSICKWLLTFWVLMTVFHVWIHINNWSYGWCCNERSDCRLHWPKRGKSIRF